MPPPPRRPRRRLLPPRTRRGRGRASQTLLLPPRPPSSPRSPRPPLSTCRPRGPRCPCSRTPRRRSRQCITGMLQQASLRKFALTESIRPVVHGDQSIQIPVYSVLLWTIHSQFFTW